MLELISKIEAALKTGAITDEVKKDLADGQALVDAGRKFAGDLQSLFAEFATLKTTITG